MALRGNYTLGGSQASENIALTRRDGLAVLHCVSLTTADNIFRQSNAAWRKVSLALFKALLHIVRQHWHAAALFLKLFAASERRWTVRPIAVSSGGSITGVCGPRSRLIRAIPIAIRIVVRAVAVIATPIRATFRSTMNPRDTHWSKRTTNFR